MTWKGSPEEGQTLRPFVLPYEDLEVMQQVIKEFEALAKAIREGKQATYEGVPIFVSSGVIEKVK